MVIPIENPKEKGKKKKEILKRLACPMGFQAGTGDVHCNCGTISKIWAH